jgi:hypothetical protein
MNYVSRVNSARIKENVRCAMTLGLPVLNESDPRSGALIIAAGGPSLVDTMGEIKSQIKEGGLVMCMNEVVHFLVPKGIRIWAAAHFGPLDVTTDCIGQPHEKVKYFIASMCPPSSFNCLEGFDVTLWHAASGGEVESVLYDSGVKNSLLISSGSTIALRCLFLGWALGFRKFHLHGVDSSFEKAASVHAYPSVSDCSGRLEFPVFLNDEEFFTNPEMAAQALSFIDVSAKIRTLGGDLSVHGSGLIPAIHKMSVEKGCSPMLQVEVPEDQPVGKNYIIDAIKY